MQTTQDTERTYYVTLNLPGRRYQTKFAYTMQQVEEIRDIVAESARSVAGYNEDIEMQPLKVVKE